MPKKGLITSSLNCIQCVEPVCRPWNRTCMVLHVHNMWHCILEQLQLPNCFQEKSHVYYNTPYMRWPNHEWLSERPSTPGGSTALPKDGFGEDSFNYSCHLLLKQIAQHSWYESKLHNYSNLSALSLNVFLSMCPTHPASRQWDKALTTSSDQPEVENYKWVSSTYWWYLI